MFANKFNLLSIKKKSKFLSFTPGSLIQEYGFWNVLSKNYNTVLAFPSILLPSSDNSHPFLLSYSLSSS